MLEKPCGCGKGAALSRRDVLKASMGIGMAALIQLAISRTPAIAQGPGSELQVQHFDPATTPCARYVPDLPEQERKELYEHAKANGGRIVDIERIRASCQAQADHHAPPAPLPGYPPKRIEPMPPLEIPARLEKPKYGGGQ